MTRPQTLRTLGLLLPILLAARPLRAQYTPSTNPENLPNQYPPPLPARRGPAPRLTFELAGDVTIPGPLERLPWSSGGAMYVPVAVGVVRVPPEPGATPEILAKDVAPPSADGWLLASGGSRRYRTTAEGIVECQKKRPSGKRWHKVWRIVAPNATPAPPLLVGPRLCYPALDDRVTCVRSSNGHRLWSVDLGDRLSRAIAAWPPLTPALSRASRRDRSVEGEVLLVVPDDGASVIVLDAYDGTRIASYELPAAQGSFRSAPFVFPEGRIAVVRKGYEPDAAAVTLLNLVPAPGGGPAVPHSYNDAPSKPAPPSGR